MNYLAMYTESVEKWSHSRYEVLPKNMYRLMTQSSNSGMYYEIEINNTRIAIENDKFTAKDVYGNLPLARQIARTIIAEHINIDAAINAKFLEIWGGD